MAFNDISASAIALVVATMVLGVGAVILNGLSTGLPVQNTDSVAWNVTQHGLGGLNAFGSWFNVVVMVVIGVILLALVLKGFARGQ